MCRNSKTLAFLCNYFADRLGSYNTACMWAAMCARWLPALKYNEHGLFGSISFVDEGTTLNLTHCW